MQNFDSIHPIYYVGNYEEKLINNIEKNLEFILVNDDNKKTNLKIKSRVRSIHSSLAIEANSLSLNNVEDIVKDKKVFGKRKEIQEVINANLVYERIKEFNWKKETDLLKAHAIMMKYLCNDEGKYRNHGEAIKKGNEIIYRAPESILVPTMMQSLFKFINENDKKIHPLVLASLFHYYFVYIHPFSDGNGRMARFWVSLILFNWKEEFEYIPFEEEIYLNQKKYYDAIAECHINGNANSFIKFMLKVINNTLEKTTQKTTQKNNLKLSKNRKEILELIQKNPKVTRKEIADFINITSDGVKYHLKKLIDNNIIKRVGPTNGGYWEIIGRNQIK